MTFDRATNTIGVGPGSDFVADSGAFFVTVVLRGLATKPDAPPQIRQDWDVIEQWLGSKGHDVTKTDELRVAKAWRAYVVLGIAPSEGLRPAFRFFSNVSEEERTRLLTEIPPPQVLEVFGRLLATQPERERRNLRQDVTPTPPAWTSWFKSLSRAKRLFIVATAAWCLWVVFRTSDGYELLGVRLREWDDDMFLINLALPPALIAAAYAAYQWIKRGEK